MKTLSWMLLVVCIWSGFQQYLITSLDQENQELKEQLGKELPFDPRLCKNTGIAKTYFIIPRKNDPDYIIRPILDCTEHYDLGEIDHAKFDRLKRESLRDN